MADLTALVVPLKTLAVFPGWSLPDDTGYSWFNAPVEIGGVVEPGLVLHGGCYIRYPDRHVTLSLELSKTPGRKVRPLERIDWRSLTGGHSNPKWKDAPPGYRGRRVSDTHLHAFDMNWSEANQRMKDQNLPYAREIDEELPTFQALIGFAGKQLRISNINVVTAPPWEYALALGNDG